MKDRVTWLLQSSHRNDIVLRQEVEALNKLGYPWKDFGVIPFTTEITGLDEPLEFIIVRAGTKIASLVKENKTHWMRKGMFYNTPGFFDQQVHRWSELPMLNSDVEFFDLSLHQALSFSEAKFVKPTNDLKAFNAGILEAGQTVQEFIGGSLHQPHAFKEHILVSSVKDVVDEYRFFVIDGKVITGSQYKVNKQLKYQSLIIFDKDHVDAAAYAAEQATIFKPDDVFTLDICKTADGKYSIVEYNCFNCSGLYACDVPKLFAAVNELMVKRIYWH